MTEPVINWTDTASIIEDMNKACEAFRHVSESKHGTSLAFGSFAMEFRPKGWVKPDIYEYTPYAAYVKARAALLSISLYGKLVV